MQERNDKVDVAINIFAKPYQTALSILSLLDKSGPHINSFWLQFEPMGSKFDTSSPYAIAAYLRELGISCHISQPENWLAREAATDNMLKDANARLAIRYENAFENSKSKLLFLMHNDVFVLQDVLGDMKQKLGSAFAIGQLGQCWNCPAANAELARDVLGTPPCKPDSYQTIKPSHKQLCELYQEARKRGIFARPYEYDNFAGEFEEQPWPLPECRINEWAILINLELVRPLCIPHGDAWPPGAFRLCAGHNLDIITPFFRDLHAKGLHARHFDLSRQIKHWVGTGNKSALKYAYSEDRAQNLLKKHYPAYIDWLNKTDKNIL